MRSRNDTKNIRSKLHLQTTIDSINFPIFRRRIPVENVPDS